MGHLKDKHIIRFWNGLFFIAMLIFWRFCYANHLLHKEQMQLFLLTSDYLKTHLQVQGGLSIYLGGFLTQFFLNKWAASILVAALLVMFAIGIQKVLKNVSGEGFYPLSFLPAIGYHFLLFNPYFKLAGLVAVTLSVWSVVALVQFKKAKQRTFSVFVLLLINYWFCGGAFLLFTLSAVVIELLAKAKQNTEFQSVKSPLIIVSVYVLSALFLPVFTRRFLVTDHLLSAWFSRAFYQFSFLLPFPVILMLLSLPLLVIFYSLIPKIQGKIWPVLTGAVLFAGFVLGSVKLPDFAEEREMYFDNLAHFQKWEEIIDLAQQEAPTGKEGKVALTLALANTEKMSTLLFHFNPEPNDFFIPFNIMGQAPLIANDPYFYLGLINFSKMLCNETIESTPDESRPVRMMQRLAEDYIISGQNEVASRYLWYLKRTIFYRKWAESAEEYLANKKTNLHPEWVKLEKQLAHDDFYFQYDRIDAALISLLRSDPHNKMAYEYLMNWYLLRKDFDSFLKYLPLVYAMNYKSVPVVFQEAVAYIKTLYEEVPEGLKQYPVSLEVEQQLTRYAQAFQQGGSKQAAGMKKLFGNTYWYYVHFTDFENETSGTKF